MNYETLVYFSYSLESLAVLLCNFFLLYFGMRLVQGFLVLFLSIESSVHRLSVGPFTDQDNTSTVRNQY